MESRFHGGVPISATKMAPDAAPSIRGIRAPITVDESDFEYSASSKSHIYSTTSSYFSGSDLEFEGFESGEELGSESDRAHLDEKDEEEFALSEPSLRSPDEDVGQESSDVGKNDAFRPLVRIPDGRMYRGSDNVDDSDDSGSFLSESGDEELVNDEGNVVNYSESSPLVAVMDVLNESGDELAKDESSAVYYSESRPLVAVMDALSESGDELAKDESSVVKYGDSTPLGDAMDVLSESGDELADDEGNVAKYGEPRRLGDAIDGDVSRSGTSPVVNIRIPTVQVKVPIAQISADSDDDSQGSGVSDDEGLPGIVRVPSIEILPRISSTPKVRISEFDEGNDKKLEAEKIIEMEYVDDLVITNALLGFSDEKEVKVQVKGPDIDKEATTDSLVVNEEFDVVDVIGEREKCVELDEHRDSTNLVEDIIFPDNVFNNGNQSDKVECENEVEVEIDPAVESFSSNAAHSIGSFHDSVDIMEVPTGRSSFDAVVVAEMNGVSDSPSFSNGEILSDYKQEVDDQIVTEATADGGISDRRRAFDPAADRGAVLDAAVVRCGPIIATGGESNETKIKKIQQIRAKYLHLLRRLGRSPEDALASKVLYQLTLSGESCSSQAFHLDSTKKATTELEASKMDDDLEFSLSVLVIGKTGVGKSATINSIFGEKKVAVDAFEPATARVKEIVGTIGGVKLKVFDTPGLRTSSMDQSINRKILSSIKKLMQKCPPDVILYVDRLDSRTGLDDLPLLKSLTSYLGSSMWRKSIIAFTHGASIPPDGSNGYPLSYKALVAQQSRAVQLMAGSTVPVCLLENHPLVDNGERWKSELMLLCCSIKILSELTSVVMIHPPVLKYLLSENVAMDTELCSSSDSQLEEDHPLFRYSCLEPYSELLTWPAVNSNGCNHDWCFNGSLVQDKTNVAVATRVEGFSLNETGGGAVEEWGLKLKDYDHLAFGSSKRLILVGNAGFVRSHDDNAAFGVKLELHRRDERHPSTQDHNSMWLSITKQTNDVICGFNMLYVGGRSKLNIKAAVNNHQHGQICIATRCSDHLLIAALALVPITGAVYKKILGRSVEGCSK